MYNDEQSNYYFEIVIYNDRLKAKYIRYFCHKEEVHDMPRKKHNRIDIPVPLKMVQEFKQKFPDVWEYCDYSLNMPFEKLNFEWDRTRCVAHLSWLCQAVKESLEDHLLYSSELWFCDLCQLYRE